VDKTDSGSCPIVVFGIDGMELLWVWDISGHYIHCHSGSGWKMGITFLLLLTS